MTPSEIVDTYDAVDVVDVPHIISWADTERDLSAWLGNPMQSSALHDVYKIEKLIKQKIQIVSDNPFPQTDLPMNNAEKKEYAKEKQRRKQEFFANRNKKRGAQNPKFRRNKR